MQNLLHVFLISNKITIFPEIVYTFVVNMYFYVCKYRFKTF